MSEIEAILGVLRADPLLFYSLVAAVFLALAALVAGLKRGDLVVVFRSAVLLRIGLGVTLAVGLLALRQIVTAGVVTLGILDLASLAAGDWPLGGVSRLPLYVIALGYGPSAGLLAAGLFAAFGGLGVDEAFLALELSVVGWLAIFPSPRRYRFAGPLNVLLAFSLVTATAGVAWLAWQPYPFSAFALWQQVQGQLGGLMLSVLLLALVPPSFYRRVLVNSPIAPTGEVRDAIVTKHQTKDEARARLKDRARSAERGGGHVAVGDD